VRRDGCPAVAKMLESVLRVLFSTADLSLVRSYCCRQWGKILANRVSVQVRVVGLGWFGGIGLGGGFGASVLEWEGFSRGLVLELV